MNKSGVGGPSNGDEENTKYARDAESPALVGAENTKYAGVDQNTIYANADENTKYADTDESTKYARLDENTKYAGIDENTKYANVDENTKYARGDIRREAKSAPLLRRRAVDAAIEEALMSVASAVDRIHPGISNETRAHLVETLIDKFGSELLEAHLGVTKSDLG